MPVQADGSQDVVGGGREDPPNGELANPDGCLCNRQRLATFFVIVIKELPQDLNAHTPGVAVPNRPILRNTSINHRDRRDTYRSTVLLRPQRVHGIGADGPPRR